jgi:Chitobiase/beta-hexosaminidase C-terminal domain
MTTGILPFDELKRRCHMNTGFFETSQYLEDDQMRVVSGNHDNAGLSIGNLQYNYGAADRAQEWFKYMVDNHRAIVDSAFGANIAERDEFINVTNTYTRANRITWGDSISLVDANGEKRLLAEPYKTAFGNMLVTAEGKAKYYEMRDRYYWNPIYELFRHVGCKSRASIASLFDTYVNKGRFYPVNLIQADFDRIDADTTLTEAQKEAEKIYAINYRGNYDNAVNPDVNAWGNIDQDIFWHGDGVDDGRRGCMANLEGVYYGAVYDPEVQFDINLETATDEKAGEKALNVNLGSIVVENAFLGDKPIKEIYLGATLIGGGSVAAVTSSRVPVTQFRTNPASWQGIGAATSITLEADQPLWIDVQEPFVGCRTYYTTDGSAPTTASALYTDALSFTETTVLKVLTVSVFGVASAVKTLTVNIPAEVAGGWRYLKITPDSMNGHWQGAEIQVKDSGGTNRAIGSTGSLTPAPDNANNFGSYGALVNGDTVTAGVYYTWGYPLTIFMDLGAEYNLTELEIFLGNSTTLKTKAAAITVSKDNNTYETGKVTYVNNPTTLQQHYTITT